MVEINKINEITNLYDTFLGRFWFFRKFIQFLVGKELEIQALEERIKFLEERVESLGSSTENVSALAQTPQRNLSVSSPHEILQREYDLYNKEVSGIN